MSVDPVVATRLLLLSRDDYLPAVPSSEPRGAVPGPAPSRYVPCEDCRGSGRVRGRGWRAQACVQCVNAPSKKPRHGCHACPACDGSGRRVKRIPPDMWGEWGWDEYAAMPTAELTRLREQDASLRAQEARRRPASNVVDKDATFGWERAREAYNRSGAYRDLDRQLEWLRDRHVVKYEMLMHWLSEQDSDRWVWSKRVEAGVEETITMLARRMERPVRVPSWVLARARVAKREAA